MININKKNEVWNHARIDKDGRYDKGDVSYRMHKDECLFFLYEYNWHVYRYVNCSSGEL